MNNDFKKCKSIFNPYIARNLLKLGNQIIDIKPDKQCVDKTIFIFEQTEKFENDLIAILKK